MTLDNSGSFALITVAGGSHVIDAPVVLANNLMVSGSGTLVFDAGSSITDNGAGFGLTLDGVGETLILSDSDTYSGATNVLAGTLILDSLTALPDGTSLTIGAGGASIFGFSQAAAAPLDVPANSPINPVPEPGTVALLLAAAALGLATWIRRRGGIGFHPVFITARHLLAWLGVGVAMLSAQAARGEFIQYNSANGVLTLNDAGSNYDPNLDNFTVYVQSTSGVTLNGTGGNFAPSGTTWGGYKVPNYALEWYYSSGGTGTVELPAGTYTIAQLPAGLTASAFGNAYYGLGNTVGAVFFGTESGAMTNSEVVVTPEVPGTMLGRVAPRRGGES